MTRRDRSSSAARREPGGGRPALGARALALMALVAAGCVAPPLPSGSGVPATSSPATAAAHRSPETPTTDGAPPSAIPGSSIDGAPTALPDLQPSPVSLATFTVVCEDWGGEPAVSTIDCADAASLALAAIGGQPADSVRRLDFWFGDGCDRGVPCAERRPDVGWVLVRGAPLDTLAVRVALDPAGELRAWPPLPGPAIAPPAFTSPAGGTPDLGSDLPAALRDRRLAPFCGAEDLTAPDAFATTARTCFLGGVLSGMPVELLSRSFSTEGHALLTLYRFIGRGPVLRYVRTAAGWTGSACGISPIPTRAVFLLAGTCERLTL